MVFGFNHFTALDQTAAMVPSWIPPGRMFWAVTTGLFHTTAGLAILTGFRPPLAARLLGTIMLAFGVLMWLPNLVAEMTSQMVEEREPQIIFLSPTPWSALR